MESKSSSRIQLGLLLLTVRITIRVIGRLMRRVLIKGFMVANCYVVKTIIELT